MRPRCDSTRGVLSSGGLGHLTVVPPSGLAPLARHGVCRVSSWNRRRPTTSAACHDPRTEPRIPIPADIQPAVLRLSTGLVRTRTPRCGGRPSAGGSEEAERRSRPRITISPEHRLSSPLPRPGLGKASRSRRPGTVLAASRGDRGLVFHTVARTSDVVDETGCLPSPAPDDGSPYVGSDRETMLLRAIAPGRRLCHHPGRRS